MATKWMQSKDKDLQNSGKLLQEHLDKVALASDLYSHVLTMKPERFKDCVQAMIDARVTLPTELKGKIVQRKISELKARGDWIQVMRVAAPWAFQAAEGSEAHELEWDPFNPCYSVVDG